MRNLVPSQTGAPHTEGVDGRISPYALAAIVLISVTTGAVIASLLIRDRRRRTWANFDRETGEPLFVGG